MTETPINSFISDSALEEAKLQAARRGASKLDASKSFLSKKVEEKESFEQRADAANNEVQQNNQQAADLSKEFWSIIKSSELNGNKGPLAKKREQQITIDLVAYARQINNDPKQEEDCYGSAAMFMLLFKTVLHMRDRNNELQYKIYDLENRLIALENKK